MIAGKEDLRGEVGGGQSRECRSADQHVHDDHLELDGLRIAVNHYPEIARGLAATGTYHLVCYGHDHTAHQSLVGDCVLLNPGELMGMYGESTYALFNTVSREVEIIGVS